MNTVGEAIRVTRKKKGISIAKLSELSGVTQTHIEKIESGAVWQPREYTVSRLTSALGVEVRVRVVVRKARR